MDGEEEVGVHDEVAGVVEELIHGPQSRPRVPQEENLGAGNVNLK